MSKQRQVDKLNLLGVEVDALTMTDAIDYIMTRSAPDQPPGYVIKPYVEFLDRAYHNPQLCQLLNDAELSLADGIALVWAANFLYAGPRKFWRFWLTLFQIILKPKALSWPLPERTAGINFTWLLLNAAAAHNRRVFLIGDPLNSTIGQTAISIQKNVPSLNIVGTASGRDQSQPPGEVSAAWLAALTSTVATAQPDLVLTGTGFPLQERINAYLSTQLSHGLFIGEGGTFDYESFGGHLRKAPAALQNIGLEWLWRLMLQPTRLHRQLAIPRFIDRIWRSR